MTRHHAIDYVELPAPDLDASQRFYAAALGWGFTPYGPAYAGIQRPGAPGEEMGGLAPQGTERPLVIVYSEDLDATLAAVVAAGGTVTTAPYDFPGGRRFHFTDPAGSELAVWTQAEPPPAT